MKTSIILSAIVGSFIAVNSIQAAQSQVQTASEPEFPPIVDSIAHPVNQSNQKGTEELQEKVLMQVNQGLVNGWLSAADAAELKSRLNKLSDNESWYRSMNSAIPASVTATNTRLLNEMSNKLQPKVHQTAGAKNALHSDIDDLIGNKLASNHISSSDAEKYYLRLAQIESNVENSKDNPASSGYDAVVSKELRQLKSELIRK